MFVRIFMYAGHDIWPGVQVSNGIRRGRDGRDVRRPMGGATGKMPVAQVGMFVFK